MDWDAAVRFALSLPDTELSTSFGQPAVKVASNGRALLNTGHEPATSFVVAQERGAIEMLKETEPEVFWQTPHYEGWDAVLVRYDARDEARVREVISRGRDYAASKPKARPRKAK